MAKTKQTSKTTKKPAAKPAAATPAAKKQAAKQPAVATPATKKQAAKKQAAGPKPTDTPPPTPPTPFASPAPATPKVQYLGQIESATPSGPFLEDQPMQSALYAHTRVAARLAAGDVRPHMYVAHKGFEHKVVTVLAYASAAELGKVGAELRIPQKGAWLWCPTDGFVFVLASPRWLDYKDIVKLLDDRAPGPVKGDEDNLDK